MINAEGCSAARGSLTREEIITAKLTPASESSGPTTKMPITHNGLNNCKATAGLAAKK